jgi:hypothetical protein
LGASYAFAQPRCTGLGVIVIDARDAGRIHAARVDRYVRELVAALGFQALPELGWSR